MTKRKSEMTPEELIKSREKNRLYQRRYNEKRRRLILKYQQQSKFAEHSKRQVKSNIQTTKCDDIDQTIASSSSSLPNSTNQASTSKCQDSNLISTCQEKISLDAKVFTDQDPIDLTTKNNIYYWKQVFEKLDEDGSLITYYTINVLRNWDGILWFKAEDVIYAFGLDNDVHLILEQFIAENSNTGFITFGELVGSRNIYNYDPQFEMIDVGCIFLNTFGVTMITEWLIKAHFLKKRDTINLNFKSSSNGEIETGSDQVEMTNSKVTSCDTGLVYIFTTPEYIERSLYKIECVAANSNVNTLELIDKCLSDVNKDRIDDLMYCLYFAKVEDLNKLKKMLDISIGGTLVKNNYFKLSEADLNYIYSTIDVFKI